MSKEPVFCIWDGQRLTPKTPRDLEIMQRFKLDSTVRFLPATPRNPRRHGFYWAMLNDFVRSTEFVPTSDHMHDLIKMKTGFVRVSVLKDGEVIYTPDSTAWDKMSEDEFGVFLDNALRWLEEKFGYVAECRPNASQ